MNATHSNYKVAKTEGKLNVQCARFMIYDESFRKSGTKDGQNHFCKLDKTKEMKTRIIPSGLKMKIKECK